MPSENDLGAFRTALEWADVEFTDGERPGVRLRKSAMATNWIGAFWNRALTVSPWHVAAVILACAAGAAAIAWLWAKIPR
jgi:hypothetical protein